MANVIFKTNRKTKIVSLPSYDYFKTTEGEIIEDLETAKKTKNIVLEGKEPKVFNDTKIEVYKELTVKENEELAEAAKNTTNEYSLFLITLVKSIKDWNFTKEDGKKIEVNIDNLRKFGASDLNAIMVGLTGKTLEQIAEEEDKKKLA